jgi:hypothetical protein
MFFQAFRIFNSVASKIRYIMDKKDAEVIYSSIPNADEGSTDSEEVIKFCQIHVRKFGKGSFCQLIISCSDPSVGYNVNLWIEICLEAKNQIGASHSPCVLALHKDSMTPHAHGFITHFRFEFLLQQEYYEEENFKHESAKKQSIKYKSNEVQIVAICKSVSRNLEEKFNLQRDSINIHIGKDRYIKPDLSIKHHLELAFKEVKAYATSLDNFIKNLPEAIERHLNKLIENVKNLPKSRVIHYLSAIPKVRIEITKSPVKIYDKRILLHFPNFKISDYKIGRNLDLNSVEKIIEANAKRADNVADTPSGDVKEPGVQIVSKEGDKVLSNDPLNSSPDPKPDAAALATQQETSDESINTSETNKIGPEKNVEEPTLKDVFSESQNTTIPEFPAAEISNDPIVVADKVKSDNNFEASQSISKDKNDTDYQNQTNPFSSTSSEISNEQINESDKIDASSAPERPSNTDEQAILSDSESPISSLPGEAEISNNSYVSEKLKAVGANYELSQADDKDDTSGAQNKFNNMSMTLNNQTSAKHVDETSVVFTCQIPMKDLTSEELFESLKEHYLLMLQKRLDEESERKKKRARENIIIISKELERRGIAVNDIDILELIKPNEPVEPVESKKKSSTIVYEVWGTIDEDEHQEPQRKRDMEL